MIERILIATGLTLCAGLAPAETVFTGETVQGARVISQLDVADLAAGEMHRFMFRGAETAAGQYWYVPVIVAKGAKPGKRILFAAGVHGDELNPIAAVQATFASLDPKQMSGTAIALIGPSRDGVENTTRTWSINQLGGEQVNPNRTWPGREHGNTVERHSWLITHKLIRGNVDIGIDHHTGGTGIETEFVVKGLNKLNELIFEKINRIDGVLRTETSLFLNYVKRQYDWGTAVE